MSEGDIYTLWVDVSQHDWNRYGGQLDWQQIRHATSPVMSARATYGDPAGWNRATYHFGDFQQAAAAAGFTCRGGYHNLVRGDAASMRRQVDWLRRELDAYGCDWGMADVERYKELVDANMWPRYEDVLRFRDAWYAVEDRTLMWYIARWVWAYWGGGADLTVLPGPLNQAHYLDGIYGTPSEIYEAGGANNGTGWDDCFGGRCPDFWQYTATCSCPGASDRTDVNAFRGTPDQLVALLTTGGQPDMDQQQINWLYNTSQITYYLSQGADSCDIVDPDSGNPNLPVGDPNGHHKQLDLTPYWNKLAAELSPDAIAAIAKAAAQGANTGAGEAVAGLKLAVKLEGSAVSAEATG